MRLERVGDRLEHFEGLLRIFVVEPNPSEQHPRIPFVQRIDVRQGQGVP